MTNSSSIRQCFALVSIYSAVTVPSALAQDTYLQTVYQDVEYLQKGLFESPLPGIADPAARTLTKADSITDMLHFSVSAGIRYDNNIFLSEANPKDDFIFSVSPTLSLVSAEEGTALNTFAFSYTPTFSFYASNTDRNSIDHRASFRYGKTMPKSKIAFNVAYTNSSGSNRFRSGAIDQSSITAGVSFSHVISSRTRFDISAGTGTDNFGNSDLHDVSYYNVRASLLYQATGKLSIGPSVAYRHSNVSASRNQDSYETGLKFNYQATGKTSVNGTLGYNILSFDGAGASSNKSSLAWSIGVNHRFSSKTNFRASLYSRPNVSYNIQESGYFATGVAFNASHQLSSKTSLYGMVTYENDDYFKTDGNNTNLNNDYYTATLGARYKMNNGVSLGANMTWRSNSGNISNNDFDGFTAGVNASYSFW